MQKESYLLEAGGWLTKAVAPSSQVSTVQYNDPVSTIPVPPLAPELTGLISFSALESDIWD